VPVQPQSAPRAQRKGVGYELRREYPWDGSDEFYACNPAGRTPVLQLKEKNLTLVDSQAICEYFEETVDKSPLILGTAAGPRGIRR
jgi:glutathione S-transferase